LNETFGKFSKIFNFSSLPIKNSQKLRNKLNIITLKIIFLMSFCKSISTYLFGKPRELLPSPRTPLPSQQGPFGWHLPPPLKIKILEIQVLLMNLKNSCHLYQFSLSFDLQIVPLTTFHSFIHRKIKEYSRIFWGFYREYGIEYFGGFLSIKFRALIMST